MDVRQRVSEAVLVDAGPVPAREARLEVLAEAHVRRVAQAQAEEEPGDDERDDESERESERRKACRSKYVLTEAEEAEEDD